MWANVYRSLGCNAEVKKAEVLCLSRKPRQCMLQVSRNALRQVEKFKYLGVVFTSDGRRNGEIDTWIRLQNKKP